MTDREWNGKRQHSEQRNRIGVFLGYFVFKVGVGTRTSGSHLGRIVVIGRPRTMNLAFRPAGKFNIPSPHMLHVFGLWEEAGGHANKASTWRSARI